MSQPTSQPTSQPQPIPPTAISSPQDLIRLATAFCEARAVYAAIELGLFPTLRQNPQTEPELRQRLGLAARGTRDWLNLLVALGMLVNRDGRYHLTTVAELHLVPDSPGFVGSYFAHTERLYPAWAKLVPALRTGERQQESDFDTMVFAPDKHRRFLELMDGLNDWLGPELAQALDFSGYRTVADVGGARGNLIGHILKAHPHLTGYVFDVRATEPFFDEHVATLGLTDRIRYRVGDFFTDPLPEADVQIIGHTLQDWSPEQRAVIVANACRSTRPGGAVLIYDRMLDESRPHLENQICSLTLQLTTPGGSEYTVDDCRGYLAAAGFDVAEARPLSEMDTLVIGRRTNTS